MSGELSAILDPGCIFLNLAAKKRRRLVEELAEKAAVCCGIDDHKSLAREVWKREKLSTTAVGHGVAIPHRLTNLVDDTRMVFGRAPHGVPFDAVDNEPVRILVMLLGPEGAHGRHLKLLSRLARLLSSVEFREDLLSASTPDEIIEAFRRKEEQTGGGGGR